MTEKIVTDRAVILLTKSYVYKNYKKASVRRELEMYELFRKAAPQYAVPVDHVYEDSFRMLRMDFALGSADRLSKTSVRQLFNTISMEKVEFQLSGILNALGSAGLCHCDINPSSLLFSRSEGVLKLVSFYWAHLDSEPCDVPSDLNRYYSTNDAASIIRLTDELGALWDLYANH